MHIIKDLASFFKQNHINPLQSLSKAKVGSKLLALYEGIIKGRFKSDEEAAKILYNEESAGSKYRKLKSDLKDRLVEAVSQSDINEKDMSDYQKAYHQCHRDWLSLRLLSGQNFNESALCIAQRLLKKTAKYDFTFLCLDITSYLRLYFGLLAGDRKQMQEYSDLFLHYETVYKAESEAETLYASLIVNFINQRSKVPSLQNTVLEAYNRVEPLLEQFKTYRVHLYGRMIGIMRFTNVDDHAGALKYSEESIHFFEALPYEARVPLQMFYLQCLKCHVQLHQFEEGLNVAARYNALVREGTYNWFKYKELKLYMYLHHNKFEEGASILVSVLKHNRFSFLPENSQEIWRLYEAYLYWLATMGKIESLSPQKYKPARFLNSTPIFSKDKSGINVAILIIKYLYLFSKHKYSQMIDEAEGLAQYTYRYLNDDTTRRSFLFVKMLVQLPMSGFDPRMIRQKSERYRRPLLSQSKQGTDNVQEIEIVPYEYLWETILEHLG
jgi:hypothetical protein